jgi:hypothetical protein
MVVPRPCSRRSSESHIRSSGLEPAKALGAAAHEVNSRETKSRRAKIDHVRGLENQYFRFTDPTLGSAARKRSFFGTRARTGRRPNLPPLPQRHFILLLDTGRAVESRWEASLGRRSRPAAKVPVAFKAVVRAAPERDVVRSRRSASCEWHDVMEFEASSLIASSSRSDERTLAAVSCPHFPPDVGRDVPRTRCPQTLRAPSSRTRCGRNFLSFELRDETCQGALDDGGGIGVGVCMTH